MISIRPFTEQDLEPVLAIQNQAPEAAQWPPASYILYDAAVAEVAGRLAGFVVVRHTADDEHEILNLAVHRDYRRQGIARQLIAHALAAPASLASGHNWYLEVRESNHTAISLYAAAGFQPSGLRRNYYNGPPESAIVMHLVSCYRHGASPGK